MLVLEISSKLHAPDWTSIPFQATNHMIRLNKRVSYEFYHTINIYFLFQIIEDGFLKAFQEFHRMNISQSFGENSSSNDIFKWKCKACAFKSIANESKSPY